MENKESLLSVEYLRNILSYNQDTGEFRWNISTNKVRAGDVTGCINKDTGYRQVRMKIGNSTRQFQAHRLAWLYVYGVWPNGSLDHIDRNRDNNRISNLREATDSQNKYNKTKKSNCSSRYVGVSWSDQRKKWCSSITLRGKNRNLGRFNTEEEAALAYNKAALARDPNFHNLNVVKQHQSA